MKKIITILILFISAKCFSQVDNNFMQKNTFWDTTYFKNVPYSASAGVVHLGIDTVVGSPTYGKLVRKTAGGSTPTLQQVFNTEIGGSVLSKTDSILLSGNSLKILGNSNSTNYTFGNTGLFSISNTGAVQGISVTTNTGDAILATTTSSNEIMYLTTNPSSTNTIIDGITIERTTSGTAADGIGAGINLKNERTNGSTVTTNRVMSKLADASSAFTSQFIVSGVSNTQNDTLMTLGGYVNLTESSATTFTSTTVGTGKIQGGSMLVTVEGNDATDFQSRTLKFIWSAVNKGGTITATLSTPEEVVAISNGSTLTCTITTVDAGSGVLNFKANAVSSLSQSTLRCSYQTFKNF